MENNDVIEISFEQIWVAILKAFVPCSLIIIIMTTLAFLGTKLFIDEQYTATAKLIIVQEKDDSSQVTYSDLQISQKLTSTYSEILKSEAISDDVLRNITDMGYISNDDLENPVYYDTESYNNMVKVNSIKDTEVINISVETNDPKLSALMANEIVKVFNNKIYNIMKIENVTVLNQAKVPLEKSGPSLMTNMALGAILGFVIDGIIIVVMIFNDRKVKTEEEVKAIFETPIIGLIPNVEGIGE